ncbi:hypothetical protein L195_g033889 [Trifolium pratense]|uniref:Uncharacterized protein n=1 Tax=Trifolium pratense TaxID=57577 RepID=A0A2K3LH99_TRIPR|nr:hypothetical protein L195_g033889 [Trifolium pratense]
MFPLKWKLLHPYTCTAISHTAQRDPPPDHLCHDDFRYMESVQPFVESSALIPLLGHHEGTIGGSSTLECGVQLTCEVVLVMTQHFQM